MKTDVEVISNQHELEDCYQDIASLFSRAFGRDLSRTLWEQYYVENPYGPPRVVILVKDRELVGHYGLVPQTLVGTDGHIVPYYLAITLMMAPEHQNTQNFVLLVSRLLEAAHDSKCNFLLAFPNQRSFLPLNKLFGWHRLVETPFYRMVLAETDCGPIAIKHLERLDTDGGLSVPYDDTYWQWRSRRNTYQACQAGQSLQLVYKTLDEEIMDVMDLTVMDHNLAQRDLRRFAAQAGFAQVVLTGHHIAQLGLEITELERWGEHVVRMCYWPLSRMSTPDVRFNLMLCDVF